MSQSKRAAVEPELIPLSRLVPRPGHANVLPRRRRVALAEHIRRSGRYPPLIVRPHPRRRGAFELLDGHHRAAVLGEIGARAARCEVWRVDDAEAGLLSATLNDLRGRPDAVRRARQVRRVVRRLGPQTAAGLLGLTPAGLAQKLAPLRRVPQVRSADGGALDLRPVVFHLRPQDARDLERALRRRGAPRRGRAEALMAAVRAASRRE